MEYEDSVDREHDIAQASGDARRDAERCDDGHEWPQDYTSGDTCWCGAFYLTTLADGRMKLTEPSR